MAKIDEVISRESRRDIGVAHALAEGGVLPMYGMPTRVRPLYLELSHEDREGPNGTPRIAMPIWPSTSSRQALRWSAIKECINRSDLHHRFRIPNGGVVGCCRTKKNVLRSQNLGGSLSARLAEDGLVTTCENRPVARHAVPRSRRTSSESASHLPPIVPISSLCRLGRKRCVWSGRESCAPRRRLSSR